MVMVWTRKRKGVVHGMGSIYATGKVCLFCGMRTQVQWHGIVTWCCPSGRRRRRDDDPPEEKRRSRSSRGWKVLWPGIMLILIFVRRNIVHLECHCKWEISFDSLGGKSVGMDTRQTNLYFSVQNTMFVCSCTILQSYWLEGIFPRHILSFCHQLWFFWGGDMWMDVVYFGC
jgi:hypothetical protein